AAASRRPRATAGEGEGGRAPDGQAGGGTSGTGGSPPTGNAPGAAQGGPRERGAEASAAPPAAASQPHTAWMSETTTAFAGRDEQASYAALQQLLAGRRALIGKLRSNAPKGRTAPLDTDELMQALGRIQ